MPRARARTLVAPGRRASRPATVDLDPGADRDEVRGGAAGAARHRPVDRRLPADAGARRPRQRSSRATSASAAGSKRLGAAGDPRSAADRGRGVATLAVVRAHAPLGRRDAADHRPEGPTRDHLHDHHRQPGRPAAAHQRRHRPDPVSCSTPQVDPTWSTEPCARARRGGRAARRVLRRRAHRRSTCRSSRPARRSSGRIWLALREIPYAETINYGQLALRVGNPNASRAVGLANGRNPISIVVPCHRVIGADGSLTGYGGGLDRKRLLLDLERRVAGRRGPAAQPALRRTWSDLVQATGCGLECRGRGGATRRHPRELPDDRCSPHACRLHPRSLAALQLLAAVGRPVQQVRLRRHARWTGRATARPSRRPGPTRTPWPTSAWTRSPTTTPR